MSRKEADGTKHNKKSRKKKKQNRNVYSQKRVRMASLTRKEEK